MQQSRYCELTFRLAQSRLFWKQVATNVSALENQVRSMISIMDEWGNKYLRSEVSALQALFYSELLKSSWYNFGTSSSVKPSSRNKSEAWNNTRVKKRVLGRVLPRVMHRIRSETLGKTLGETLWCEKSRQESRQESCRDPLRDSWWDSWQDSRWDSCRDFSHERVLPRVFPRVSDRILCMTLSETLSETLFFTRVPRTFKYTWYLADTVCSPGG